MEFRVYDRVRVRGQHFGVHGVLVDGPYPSCDNSRGWTVELVSGEETIDVIVCSEKDLFLISREARNV